MRKDKESTKIKQKIIILFLKHTKQDAGILLKNVLPEAENQNLKKLAQAGW